MLRQQRNVSPACVGVAELRLNIVRVFSYVFFCLRSCHIHIECYGDSRMNPYAIAAAVPRSILRRFAGATGLVGSGMVRKS